MSNVIHDDAEKSHMERIRLSIFNFGQEKTFKMKISKIRRPLSFKYEVQSTQGTSALLYKVHRKPERRNDDFFKQIALKFIPTAWMRCRFAKAVVPLATTLWAKTLQPIRLQLGKCTK